MSTTCTITGTIRSLDGTPAAGQQIIISVKSTADDQGGQLASYTPEGEDAPILVGVTSDAMTFFTDENGAFEIELLKGASVLVEIPGINLRKEISVPSGDTVVFSDLI